MATDLEVRGQGTLLGWRDLALGVWGGEQSGGDEEKGVGQHPRGP